MKREYLIILLAIAVMAAFFLIGRPELADDGYHYEGFTESLARGVVNFKSYYGFMGLSILSVPLFWLTGSQLSIVYTSMLLVLLSLPLVYLAAKSLYGSRRAGLVGLMIFLLTPYPYTTLMRGFQEGALLFFILLIIYASLNYKKWTPLVWAFGGIVKPFALVLFPLFIKDFLPRPNLRQLRLNLNKLRFNLNKSLNKTGWLVIAMLIGAVYLGVSYYQVGHLINNAAVNSYQGEFDTGNPPSLVESFTVGWKGPLRVGANLLLAFRKIMVSPFLILVGLYTLWKQKDFKYRYHFLLAIVLNFLLLSFMTFSFSKYLLPATTLISLAAIPLVMKHRWAMLVFLADSLTVFWPIWKFFGHVYWPNIYVYLLPYYLVLIIFVLNCLIPKNEQSDHLSPHL